MTSPLANADTPAATPFSNPDPFSGSRADNGNDGSSRSDVGLGDENQGPKFERVDSAQTTAGEDVRALTTTTSANDSQKDLDKSATLKSKMKHAANKFHLDSIKASGVSRIFNPTRVLMHIRIRADSDEQSDDSGKMVDLLWRARDNRKGRNSIAVPMSETPLLRISSLEKLNITLRETGKTLLEMFTTFPYWDMAFWSGWSYTIGSALFVIDGAFAWGPLEFPGDEFEGEAKYGVPLCFFFGAIFYQIGAVMAYLEAVNDGSFHGSAMRRIMDGHDEQNKQMLDEKLHSFFGNLVPHHHKQKTQGSDLEAQEIAAEHKAKSKVPRRRRGGIDLGGEEGEFSPYLTWRWWPTWHVLRTHHIYEIGYLACTIQLFGVTLYGITAIVILPGILDNLNEWQTNAAYWIPQMVAAACFLIASIMFMLETQDKWYKPAPKLLGWWIGAWSIAGSVGFELCAGFGPTSQNHTWAGYQSSLSSMWGSAAYLIGSFLQWYEAVNKNPEVVLGI